jgi:hypothetical protein
MDELLRPVAVAQRFFSETQDPRNKENFKAVADHFENQFGTAGAAAHQVIHADTIMAVFNGS